MVNTTKGSWSRFGQTVKQLCITLLGLDSRETIPPDDCVARRHAGCNDFSHCRHCSTLEEVFRTAAWIERDWPHVRGRNRT